MRDFLEKLGLRDKEKRRLWQLGLLLLFGLGLMGLSSGLAAPRAEPALAEADIGGAGAASAAAAVSPEEELERRLAAVLSRIEGAGEVSVSLTFAVSAQTEYAVNASATLRTTEEAGADGQRRSTTEETRSGSLALADGAYPVSTGGAASAGPVAVKESMAQVQGVLVVAQGADKPRVCAQIAEALQNLLALPAHKIVICHAAY